MLAKTQPKPASWRRGLIPVAIGLPLLVIALGMFYVGYQGMTSEPTSAELSVDLAKPNETPPAKDSANATADTERARADEEAEQRVLRKRQRVAAEAKAEAAADAAASDLATEALRKEQEAMRVARAKAQAEAQRQTAMQAERERVEAEELKMQARAQAQALVEQQRREAAQALAKAAAEKRRVEEQSARAAELQRQAALEAERVRVAQAQQLAAEKAAADRQAKEVERLATARKALGTVTLPPMLKRLKCAALDAEVSDGSVKLVGFGGNPQAISGFAGAIKALPEVGGVSSSVRQLGSGTCPMLEEYAPYWRSNRAHETPARLQPVTARDGRFKGGEPLVLDVRAAGFGGYIYIDYYSLDGNVVHMVPSPRAAEQQVSAKFEVRIGELGEWIVAPPFGTEVITLLVSSEPLFAKPRPEVESSASYFEVLRAGLARVNTGAGSVVADIIVITTGQ